MSKIGQPPRAPVWPWGGPRSIREKLVDPAQLERKKKAKAGNPRNPALASSELLDFMGPGHASDELRLPPPPSPFGDGSPDVNPFPDRTFTRSVVARQDDGQKKALDAAFARVQADPTKLERMRAVVQREAQMLTLLKRVQDDTDGIIEMMKREHKASGNY